ncbi:MAG: HNH endonuclease [Bacteroidetes bacterium]|nr:HNH endonuclease [Bacteroidota bacterium]
MPYKPKRPCSHPGCPRLTDGRYCDEHAKLAARTYERYKRNPDSKKRYGYQWRKISKQYLAEHPFCELCIQKGRMTPATLVHHTRNVSEGGTNDEENLMALCASCHSHLHAQRGDRWHTR